jgi:hypothetical protein
MAMDNDQIALLVRQALGANGMQSIVSDPLLAKLLGQSQAAPQVAAMEQPAATSLTEHEVLFINLFRAFIATDEGNPMVGILTKFARFAQSEVDKSRVK